MVATATALAFVMVFGCAVGNSGLDRIDASTSGEMKRMKKIRWDMAPGKLLSTKGA